MSFVAIVHVLRAASSCILRIRKPVLALSPALNVAGQGVAFVQSAAKVGRDVATEFFNTLQSRGAAAEDVANGVSNIMHRTVTGAEDVANGVAHVIQATATGAGDVATPVTNMLHNRVTSAQGVITGVVNIMHDRVAEEQGATTVFDLAKGALVAYPLATTFLHKSSAALKGAKNIFTTSISFGSSKFKDVHWFVKVFVAGGAFVKYVVGYTLSDLKILYSWVVGGDVIESFGDTKKKDSISNPNNKKEMQSDYKSQNDARKKVSNSNTNDEKEMQSFDKSQKSIKIKNYIQDTKASFEKELARIKNLLEEGDYDLDTVKSMITEVIQGEEFRSNIGFKFVHHKHSKEGLDTVLNQDHEVEFTGESSAEA